MKKILYILYQPYKWLVFVPILLLSTSFFALLVIPLTQFFGSKIGSKISGSWWSRLICYVTPMYVETIGKENIDKNQSYVIISNHQSFFDIFVIYGWLGIDFKWVMKQELRKVPLLGLACEKVGHIFIDRSNRQAAIDSLNKAKKIIVNGTSVIFFPEGTRKNKALGSFKKGAFIMALDLELPILPLTIINTRNILPPDSFKLFPGKAKMIVHPPIDISKYNKDNIDKLMNDARNSILSAE